MDADTKLVIGLAAALGTIFLLLQIADKGAKALNRTATEAPDLWISEGAYGKVL